MKLQTTLRFTWVLTAVVLVSCSKSSEVDDVGKMADAVAQAADSLTRQFSTEAVDATRQNLKSHLRNLQTAQETFCVDSNYYASNVVVLQSTYSYPIDKDIEISTSQIGSSYTGKAKHKKMSITCTLEVSGEIACD